MNNHSSDHLGMARVGVEDAQYECSQAQRWLVALFAAIGEARTPEDVRALADIGAYLAERSASVISSDLADVTAQLAKVPA